MVGEKGGQGPMESAKGSYGNISRMTLLLDEYLRPIKAEKVSNEEIFVCPGRSESD